MFWRRQPKSSAEGKPVLIWVIVLIGLALAIIANAVFGSTSHDLTPVELRTETAPLSVAEEPPVPPGLQTGLEQLAGRLPGKNAVLVRSIDERWVAGARGATVFPQGSLRRIWLGAALLDAVDHGELSLDQRVPLSPHGGGAARSEQVRTLLKRAIAENDRAAQDDILAGLMGPAGMATWLEERSFDEIAFGPAYRDLARSQQSGKHGGSQPDGATPDGMAFALGELFAGRTLREDSTRLLFEHFASGPEPRNGTISGWQILQLAGSSPAIGRATAAGAIAVARSRTGQRYSIVVFASGAGNPAANRDLLLTGTITALERYTAH